MKKFIMWGFVAVVTATISIAAFARSNKEEVRIESSMNGRGPCTQPGCRCLAFNQRPGYYQCWCGHQSFSHK
ncbi:MAG: hypothetical protein IJ537_10355 [Bacteroidaceae bacterium]|nr:hypothetical protein [Bacteroidaceae bacterium]MBQ9295005.1 hypothetical protein [Bacteroidaceae bacterium]